MTHKAALARHGLFDARVPRFTSYPPATRFGTAVGPQTMETWLASIPQRGEVSLYVHIPFCRRLCWFCACRTQGTRTDAPLPGYVSALLTEADTLARLIGKEIRVTRLHLGGGTPTILPPDQIDRLLGGLKRTFGFDAIDEVSAEIDPTECDEARLDALVAHGLSRASLGVQDFDPKVQKAIGRIQSLEVTRAMTEALRKAGIGSVNFDLLYGLPFQTGVSLSRTVRAALQLAPDRLALYGYAHVPWMSKRQVLIPHDALPGAETRLELFERARSILDTAGYTPIGIDHFALPGDGLARAAQERRLARSFQGYTDDRAPVLLGLGASAISRFPQGYAQNNPATALYRAAVAGGTPATSRGLTLDRQDRVVGAIVESLMCHGDVRLEELTAGAELAPAMLDEIADEFADCVDWDGRRLTVRDWARPLMRIIAARVGTVVEAGTRFSTAV